jgi:hypothetical protein
MHGGTIDGGHVVIGVFEAGSKAPKDQSFYVNNDRTVPFDAADKTHTDKGRPPAWLPGSETGRKRLLEKAYNGDHPGQPRIGFDRTGPNPSDTGGRIHPWDRKPE